MSYVGINPKNNIYPFIEKKPDSSYSNIVKNEIHLISFSKNGFAKPFGSYTYRIQKYPGDIDLLETYSDCCDVNTVIKKFEKSLKKVVKQIIEAKNHYFSEFKAGIDKKFDVNIGEIRNGNYYINPELNKITNKLLKDKLLKKDEANILFNIINKSNTKILNGDDYDVVNYIFREHRILRWTAKEILEGVKKLPGKRKIKLNTALSMMSPVKIDVISLIQGKYIEITNFVMLAIKEDEHYIPINLDFNIEDKQQLNNVAKKQLPEEIEKLYYSNMYYGPFKMIKRMYALARQIRDNNMLEKIIPFISSNTSLLYQLKSEIDTILLIFDRVKKPPLKTISKQLDEMKNKITTVIELDIEENELINEYIDMINRAKLINKKAELLKELKYILVEVINFETITYLNNVGLNPPPYTYLPHKLKYANIIRQPEDNPLNPIKVVGAGPFQVGSNLYRKIFCQGKSRKLKDGEYHLGCHNFTGPGTRIDLNEVKNFKPYNDIDACSKQHDIDYLNASELPDDLRMKKIRSADKKVIECYDQFKNESGYNPAKLGINSKMSFENSLPILTKSIIPNYVGKGGCDNYPYCKLNSNTIVEV